MAGDIAFGPANLGRSDEEIDRLVRKAMELVALPYAEFAQRSPLSLSGGQRRRAAIAGVLAMDPEVVVLDEPTASLDPELTGEVLNVMRDLAASGMTLLVVTHEIGFARDVSDRVAYFHEGVIEELGPPSQVNIHAREKETFVQQSHLLQHPTPISRGTATSRKHITLFVLSNVFLPYSPVGRHSISTEKITRGVKRVPPVKKQNF